MLEQSWLMPFSKGDFPSFRSQAANANMQLDLEPSWVPPALLVWVANPTDDDDLGQKILLDLADKTPIVGYNL